MKEKGLNEKIVDLLDDKKAENIIDYNVEKTSPFFEHVIIATANNMRMLDGLEEHVEKFLKDNNYPIHHTEGTKESGWILIDAYDVIIHLMSIEERDRVKLEDIFDRAR